jgi:hypothetical protein
MTVGMLNGESSKGETVASGKAGLCGVNDFFVLQGPSARSRPPEGDMAFPVSSGERAGCARPSAPVSVLNQRGASPLQVYLLRPVTDCNCVVVRRGGEQQEVNDQSVG